MNTPLRKDFGCQSNGENISRKVGYTYGGRLDSNGKVPLYVRGKLYKSFSMNAGCRLPQKCVKCAGPNSANEFALAFGDKLTCANCGVDHAAKWRRCPKFPKQGGKKSVTPKFKITPHTNRYNPEPSRTQQPQGMQKIRPNVSYARALAADETDSITDDIHEGGSLQLPNALFKISRSQWSPQFKTAST
ncbi:hypothetical protein AVEN_166421-1 [Araneus ventricosus]|uniref:Uncharacterized protein n=1 Tax=Araneus ventricosus TaxID=182803 RepID=A0A4Y2F0C0_ARAVE|nr:hypothetical protein AVEN_166421-1 [Araneus ventricosus]